MPPRPLHYQLLLGRDVFVAEQMDMHLVWTMGRIFLKPIPRFLLTKLFWIRHLRCDDGCRCSAAFEGQDPVDCPRRVAWKCALGFLFSYAALIRHESDFAIAKEKHLLPGKVEWPAWRSLVEQLDTEHIYPNIDRRFIYGELRLSRLNKIYCLSQFPFLRGYMAHWHQYGTFFRDNLAWLASATVYAVIVLTAMQVGLAIKSLASNDTFQSASYDFAVLSILSPLIAAGLILIAFSYIFVKNWIATVAYRKKRLRNIRSVAP
jgi:hypothetical protein